MGLSTNLTDARSRPVPGGGSIYARTLAELPDPVGTDITIPDDTTLVVDGAIDLGANRIVLGLNSNIDGTSGVSSLTSTNAAGVVLTGTGRNDLNAVTITNASGPAIVLTPGAQIVCFDMLIVGDILVDAGADGVALNRVTLDGTLEISSALPFGGLSINETVLAPSTPGATAVKLLTGGSAPAVAIRRSGIFTDATGTGIVVEAEKDWGQASLENSLVGGAGAVAVAADPVVGSSFAAPGVNTKGCAYDGANIMVADSVLNIIQRYVGISSTTDISIATPAGAVQDIAWRSEGLISADSGTDTISFHAGFTTTISSSFSVVGANVRGVAWEGRNVIASTASDQTIRIYDGITGTVLASFAHPGTGVDKLAFDGRNLWITDVFDGVTYIMDGLSATVLYTVAQPGTTIVGVSPTQNGTIVTDSSTNLVYIFDQGSYIFDQGSPNWKFSELTGLKDSSDACCVIAESLAGVSIPLVLDVWTDIADAGVAIFYDMQNGVEKFILTDPVNGEVTYIGVRPKSLNVGGTVFLLKTTGGGFDNVEIGLSINGLDPGLFGCPISPGAVSNSNRANVPIPGIPVRLKTGDTFKFQVRNRTGSNALTFFQVKLAARGSA